MARIDFKDPAVIREFLAALQGFYGTPIADAVHTIVLDIQEEAKDLAIDCDAKEAVTKIAYAQGLRQGAAAVLAKLLFIEERARALAEEMAQEKEAEQKLRDQGLTGGTTIGG